MSHELFPDFEKMPPRLKLVHMVHSEREALGEDEAYVPSDEVKELMKTFCETSDDYQDLEKLFGVGITPREYEELLQQRAREEEDPEMETRLEYGEHSLTEVITILVGIERQKIKDENVKYEPSKEVLGLIDRLIAEKEESSGHKVTAEEKDTIYKIFGLYMSDNEFLEYGMKAFLEYSMQEEEPQDIGILNGDRETEELKEVLGRVRELSAAIDRARKSEVFDPSKYAGVKMDITKESATDICCRLIYILNAMQATHDITKSIRPSMEDYSNRQMDTIAGALLSIASAYGIDIGTLEEKP